MLLASAIGKNSYSAGTAFSLLLVLSYHLDGFYKLRWNYQRRHRHLSKWPCTRLQKKKVTALSIFKQDSDHTAALNIMRKQPTCNYCYTSLITIGMCPYVNTGFFPIAQSKIPRIFQVISRYAELFQGIFRLGRGWSVYNNTAAKSGCDSCLRAFLLYCIKNKRYRYGHKLH